MVAGLPAPLVQHDRGVEVLRDRRGLDPADLDQRLAADHGARAAPERPVVAVLAGADHPEEQGLLVAVLCDVLDRVEVVELVRRLGEHDVGVLEVADHRVEEVRQRHVVGVQHRDQVALEVPERVVDVPGLRVAVVGPGQVAGAELTGELGELGPAPVVEQPRGVRVPQGPAAEQRGAQHLHRFVVGRHQHVDGQVGPRRGPVGRRRRRHPPREEGEEREAHPADRLRDEEHRVQAAVDAVVGPADPPGQVGDAPGECEHRDRARPALVGRTTT